MDTEREQYHFKDAGNINYIYVGSGRKIMNSAHQDETRNWI